VENVQLLDEAESHEQQPATDKKVLKAYQLSNGRFWRKAVIWGLGRNGFPIALASNPASPPAVKSVRSSTAKSVWS
jgi:hypothetical protein